MSEAKLDPFGKKAYFSVLFLRLCKPAFI